MVQISFHHPFGKNHGNLKASGFQLESIRAFRAFSPTQVDRLHPHGLSGRLDRYLISLFLLDGGHRSTVHRHRPQIGLGWKAKRQHRVALRFDEILGVGHHFPVGRNPRPDQGAIHHQLKGFPLGQRLQGQGQSCGLSGILIGSQHGRVDEQSMLGRDFGGFNRFECIRHGDRLDAELV